MANNVITAASGRWKELLSALTGLAPEQLSNRHQPCPLCGGRDRYRFDDRDGSGSWFCNQCGGRNRRGGAGSGMDLLMRANGWCFTEASRQVERYLGLVPAAEAAPRRRRRRHRPAASANPSAGRGGGAASSVAGLPGHGGRRPWRQPELPPPDAPPPALDQGAVAQWCYRNASGDPLFWVQRLLLRSGSKVFLHRVWLDGGWHRPSQRDLFRCDWPVPRPLYGLPGLRERPDAPVLVVEGEGTAEAASRLFPRHVVISWPNGANAVGKADWRPLAGRTVTLWPDADAAGQRAMELLAGRLQQQGCRLQMVLIPHGVVQGWDLADAHWSREQAARQLQRSARPWPAGTGGDAAARGGGDAASSARGSGASTRGGAVARGSSGVRGGAGVRGDAGARGAASAGGAAGAVDEQPLAGGGGGLPFQCLGYDTEANYYQPGSTGQILRLSRSAHTGTHLVALAPLRFWQSLYPGRMGVNWPAAASDLHQRSAAVGMFAPERIRGRGAWWDNGRSVLHLGDRLITPAGEQPITTPFPSSHIYQRLKRLEGPCGVEPLTLPEAAVIVSIANRFRWEVPASATLLSGWVVLAPICGALRWRPHLWLTAGAGTGKSAILDRFVAPLLADFALLVSGATTEAGLRQSLCSDALPVVFDEAESNERSDRQRLQAILSLARVASSESGASLLKGSPGGEVSRYRIRSMLLLSSIATALKQGADRSRFSQLTLRSPAELTREDREAHWAGLDRDLERHITPLLGRRLMARSLALLPMIRHGATVFSQAAARHFDSQRLGDQYGTLLAGAWSLLSDVAPTASDAELCIASHNWESYRQSSEGPDEVRCLQTILQRPVRVESDVRPLTRTIGELVDLVAGHDRSGEIGTDLAEQTLARHGLRLQEKEQEKRLLVSNSARAIEQILANTAWSHGWAVVLCRLPGAVRSGPVRFRGAGMVSRAVAIPLSSL